MKYMLVFLVPSILFLTLFSQASFAKQKAQAVLLAEDCIKIDELIDVYKIVTLVTIPASKDNKEAQGYAIALRLPDGTFSQSGTYVPNKSKKTWTRVSCSLLGKWSY